MRPFFSYYGGKWRAAPRYPKPMFGTIVEPFAGSAGYALRYPNLRVRLIDADPIIAGLWAYLIGVSEREISELPDVPNEGTVDDLDVCEDARHLIGFWLNGSCASPRKRPGLWMRSGEGGPWWGPQARHRIASQLASIRHWTITHGSYADAPDVEATWFVDPPYQDAGKHYRHSAVDFPHLADWCRARRGQVMVCENVGADWGPFRPFLDVKATSGVSEEALWHIEGSPMFGGC
ncbi:MAG: DNA adenine methylase [Myxococcales bacterium]|jgi:hypothetical protein|nr:DNA adenine methylase [Myxococcales bacterium]